MSDGISIGDLVTKLKSLQGQMGNMNITSYGQGKIGSAYDTINSTTGYDIEEALQILGDFADGDDKITDEEIKKWQSSHGIQSDNVDSSVRGELLRIIENAKNIVERLMSSTDSVDEGTKAKFDEINEALGIDPKAAGFWNAGTITATAAVGGAAIFGGIAIFGLTQAWNPVGWACLGVAAIGGLCTWIFGGNSQKDEDQAKLDSFTELIDKFDENKGGLKMEQLYFYDLSLGGGLNAVLTGLYESLGEFGADAHDDVKGGIAMQQERLASMLQQFNAYKEEVEATIAYLADNEARIDENNLSVDEVNAGSDDAMTDANNSMGTDGVGSANPADASNDGAGNTDALAQQALREKALSDIKDARSKLNEIINNPSMPESIKDKAREALKKLDDAEKRIDEANNGVAEALALANDAIAQANTKINEVLEDVSKDIQSTTNSIDEVYTAANASLGAGSGREALSSAVVAVDKAPQAIELAESSLDKQKQLLAEFVFEGNIPEFVQAKATLESYIANSEQNIKDAQEGQTKSEQAKANSMEILTNEVTESSVELTDATNGTTTALAPQQASMTTAQNILTIADNSEVKSDVFEPLEMMSVIVNQGNEAINQASVNIENAKAAMTNISEIKALVDANGTPEAKAEITAMYEKAMAELQKAQDELAAANKTQETLLKMVEAIKNKIDVLPEVAEDKEDDSEVDNDTSIKLATTDDDEDNLFTTNHGLNLTIAEDESDEDSNTKDVTVDEGAMVGNTDSTEESDEAATGSPTAQTEEPGAGVISVPNPETTPVTSDEVDDKPVEPAVSTDTTSVDTEPEKESVPAPPVQAVEESDDTETKRPEDEFYIEIGE